ncbi:hypothetical protein FH972_025660 [Carpinus fangiana]|uniref:Annexin n=1 Tax=Carpinus fangiana TaxID=176857 RepID=A0A5N6L216_9ROSI|nr:hypothetical protein FH972_025660 [Carpinus fangiana]
MLSHRVPASQRIPALVVPLVSERAKNVLDEVERFVEEEVIPADAVFKASLGESVKERFAAHPKILEDLKARARSLGLWNMFLPKEYKEGPGFTNVEYGLMAEYLGRSFIAPEVCNCNPPDTGNMEVFAKYGTEVQKKQWLEPLLAGKIRSAFLMTEPDKASSDATNVSLTVQKSGSDWILNGKKWWITNSGSIHCDIFLVMGKTDPTNPDQHKQQAVMLVPADSHGIIIQRMMGVFGYDDAPHGHGEIEFNNVRVPHSNILLGPGRGFEIIQGRLGPGRIHHAMRSIGAAERALDYFLARANDPSKRPFGKYLSEHGVMLDRIAQSRIDIDAARLLVLDAARRIDEANAKGAMKEIAEAKVLVPQTLQDILDRTIQAYGASGLSQDFPLAEMYAQARTMRFVDGPDEVHKEQLGKRENKRGKLALEMIRSQNHRTEQLQIQYQGQPDSSKLQISSGIFHDPGEPHQKGPTERSTSYPSERPSTLQRMAIIAVLMLALLSLIAHATPVTTKMDGPSRFTYYDMPTAFSGPCDNTMGPDGAEWIEEIIANKLARIDPDTGEVIEFDIPWTTPLLNSTIPGTPKVKVALSCALISGYDGNLYASNGLRNQLVKMDLATKQVSVFTPSGLLQPLGNLQPLNDVTAAPDGIYFTQSTGNFITHFDYKTHQFTNIAIPTPLSAPVGIYYPPEADPNGIWFCEFGMNQIGRLDLSSRRIKEYHLPPSLAGPTVMRATTDQKFLYFASTLGSAIGRIDVHSGEVKTFPVAPLSTPVEVCASDAGDVWFTHILKNSLGKLTPSTGKVEEIILPGTVTGNLPVGLPQYVGTGIFCKPGNAVWFTELSLNRGGRSCAKYCSQCLADARSAQASAHPIGVAQPAALKEAHALIVVADAPDIHDFLLHPKYPPPGQYSPAAGQYGQPPPTHGGYYQAPHQQPYGAPPGPYPPQHGAPPQQHGASQQQHGYQQPYGVPPVQPSPPSPGYDPRHVANVDTSRDADALRGAMKGFGTDEATLIRVLVAVPDPVIMANLRQTYSQRLSRDLIKDIQGETSGYFEEGLVALVRGPLAQDVYNLNDAIKGAGTKEAVLNDVLLGRSNADIHAIKAEYQKTYHRSLEADVKGDLSMKTERLFEMVLAGQRAEESAPVIPQQLERDVTEIHSATEGTKFGANQISVCEILCYRSDGQIRAISQEYERRYRRPLGEVIKKEFSGHMEDAFVRQLRLAEDRAMEDAVSLEATMAGPGTKDRLLINRLARAHWNKQHMGQIRGAYKHKYKKELVSRVEGETSSHYKSLLYSANILIAKMNKHVEDPLSPSRVSVSGSSYNKGPAAQDTERDKPAPFIASSCATHIAPLLLSLMTALCLDAHMQDILSMGNGQGLMTDLSNDMMPFDLDLSDIGDADSFNPHTAQQHIDEADEGRTPHQHQQSDFKSQQSTALSGAGAGPLPAGFGVSLPSNAGSTLTEFTKRRNWSQRVVEELKDFLHILTPDGRIIYVSPSAKQLTGYEPNALIGQFIADYIHPDDGSMFVREFNESIASGNTLRFFYRFRKQDNSYIIFESHGHPHFGSEAAAFGPNAGASFCRGFFMMARPYPTKNAALLDSFLEHKIENERLKKRIADLKREEQEELESLQRGWAKVNGGSDSPQAHTNRAGSGDGQSATTAIATSDYNGMPPPAKPSVSNTALTRQNLDEILAASQPDSINDKMARYEGATHVETIEMLTGLRYREGERSQGISLGAASPALIRGDAGIPIQVDKDGRPMTGGRAYSGSPYDGPLSDKKKKIKVADEYVCTDCGTLDSPEWRKGPNGPKTLCNACGLRWAKKEKKKSGPSNSNSGGNEQGRDGIASSPTATVLQVSGQTLTSPAMGNVHNSSDMITPMQPQG